MGATVRGAGLISAVEVVVPLVHRVTGGDWRAQIHSARHGLDVARALAARPVS